MKARGFSLAALAAASLGLAAVQAPAASAAQRLDVSGHVRLLPRRRRDAEPARVVQRRAARARHAEREHPGRPRARRAVAPR